MTKYIYKGKIRSTSSGVSLIPEKIVQLPSDDNRVKSLLKQGLLEEIKEKNTNTKKGNKDVS